MWMDKSFDYLLILFWIISLLLALVILSYWFPVLASKMGLGVSLKVFSVLSIFLTCSKMPVKDIVVLTLITVISKPFLTTGIPNFPTTSKLTLKLTV
jgi:hypothetical protein